MSQRPFLWIVIFFAILVSLFASIFAFRADLPIGEAGPKLAVHEWGTFTSFQNEEGNAIGGINVDDVPLPAFVHDLNPSLVRSSGPVRSKAVSPPRDYTWRDCTLRLETPVIYFHGPARETVNVRVKFRGGWLSQFYPNATASAPGFVPGRVPPTGSLHAGVMGELEWKGLQVGVSSKKPECDERVWTAPRQVSAADLTSAEGESERFLFYRGVGHLDSPLRIQHSADGRKFEIFGQPGDSFAGRAALKIAHLWLVEVRSSGELAFREFGPIKIKAAPQEVAAKIPAGFPDKDFNGGIFEENAEVYNETRLKNSIQAALLEEGLFPDEASALLNTWGNSYFETPGLRIFFMVPRAWTDDHLPLEISAASEITRAMIGRIELVSDEQRTILNKVSSATPSQLISGLASNYQIEFERLGRFWRALVLDEADRRSTAGLNEFLKLTGLRPISPQVSRPSGKPGRSTN